MSAERYLQFPPFQLDPVNQRLWREGQEIPLRQKTFAVLLYLIERPDQLVTKAALLEAVWPGVYVNDIAPGVCIQELRRALGDERKTPRFIATVHGRGYRFIAKVVRSQHSVASSQQTEGMNLATQNSVVSTQHSVLVGREPELAQLHDCLDKALHGERQIVFVSGEPGIGKTALVNAFRQRLETRDWGLDPAPQASSLKPLASGVWLGWGQCIEQHGAGEAFLPILDALGRLCRRVNGEALIGLLRRYAPMWLVQLPAFVDTAELETLQRKIQGASRARMLRELAEVLEALTLEQPLVLWFEDLHWSDVSTLDFLAFLARRKEPAQLMIIGTYRPVEMLGDRHPLKGVLHELYAHQLGREVALQRLTEGEVSTYLTLRFPESMFPMRLGQVLHQRTGGNPLFLASMVQDLLTRSVILQEEDGRWAWQGELAELERWTPESMRHVLARQRERLTQDDQQMLEAASLAGQEFSAATVAAALETEATQIENHCGRLAEQQQFLRQAGISEWPDGTRAGRYGFLHALYQEFWHERVSVGRQQQWHLRMGERKEAAYGQRAGEIAAELALHFEQGRDHRRAVQYLQQAGQNATQRSAYVEAISHLTKGLELFKTLPDTPEHTQQELTLQLTLSAALSTVKGYTAPDVEKTVTRARELCQQLGETRQLFPVLYRLWVFYLIRREFQTTHELAEQMLRLAQSVQDRYLLSLAHGTLGGTLSHLGELTSARTHLEQAIALYDPQQHPRATIGTTDSKVLCLSFASWTLWDLGYLDQALKRSHEALALAKGLSHPFSLAYALGFAAWFYLFRREGRLAQERAEAVMTLSTEQGFPTWLALGAMARGCALVEQGQVQEGIVQMRQSQFPFVLARLAEAYEKVGQIEEGLVVLAEALAFVDKTGERVNEAELYRMKGELLLAQEGSRLQAVGHREKTKKAEAYFLKAIETARRQQAKSWELCAVVSLARLWQTQGKKDEAHKMLAEIYGWFTEGFDTVDLKEAKALLQELSH